MPLKFVVLFILGLIVSAAGMGAAAGFADVYRFDGNPRCEMIAFAASRAFSWDGGRLAGRIWR